MIRMIRSFAYRIFQPCLGLGGCHLLRLLIAELVEGLVDEGIDIRKTLDALESRLTLEALKRCEGNKAKAAEMLGLKRTTLIERLKRLKLDKF